MNFSYIAISLKTGDIIFQSTNAKDFIARVPRIERFYFDKEANKARRKVQLAIGKGILPKAKELNCFYCGETAKEWHHSLGYSKGLEYVVIPVCKLCHSKQIDTHKQIKSHLPKTEIKDSTQSNNISPSKVFKTLDDFNILLIKRAIRRAKNNKSKAAFLLGMTRRRLYSMIERFQIKVEINKRPQT